MGTMQLISMSIYVKQNCRIAAIGHLNK